MNDIISVIVPCYNQGQYLAEAIESVVLQTYSHWECIIVNDGSTDHTEDIALELIKKDRRLSYYRINNSGVCFARNFGVEKSEGYYILPLDADDKIHDTYLDKAIKVLQHSDVKLVYCEVSFFGAQEGKFEVPEYSRPELAKMNMIICSAVFIKEDFLSAGGYNPNMKYGWEDWDFWISFLKHGGKVYRIPEILFYYRIKEQSRNKGLEGERQQKTYMQLYLNHPDFFDGYYEEPLEILPKYRSLKNYNQNLKDYNQTLLEHITFLKGLFMLKPSSYISLTKKIRKRLLK